tara:strand:- start:312 stop:539 length:228 start_codon:yes stop_codon:yes gene_type:complete
MTWIKSSGLQISYVFLRWFLRRVVVIQYLLRDVEPGLRFAWARKVVHVLEGGNMAIKLTLTDKLEIILIAQRRTP